MAASAGAESKPQKIPRRVFISYSRKDGSDAAHRLRDALITAGCDVWLDTDRIRGGASWSKDIEAALNHCDVLIAVLTEGSFVSEICRAEQIWALEVGKHVIPVLAAANAPRPLHLRTLNYRNFPDQQRELLADLDPQPQSPPPDIPRLRYDTIPPLPLNFIPREEALAKLRAVVFTEGQETNIAVTAVAGMGGIGKTVLVSALCRDKAVQRAFPDGIAWITIGREWDGDFVPRMREVAKALGDDLSGYDNALACQNRYRNMLCEKAALIVVDDVWNLEHLKLLLVDAPRSRFIFTTRDGGIAKNVTGRRYAADLLYEYEARVLLARSAGTSVAELPPEAGLIIRACNGLAAAIAQIGASLREVSLPEWADTLEALEKADISAIEEQLPSGQQSFFKSLEVSIQAIPPQMQDRYRKLAVLLEDVPAPVAVLQTLWVVKDAEARRAARFFVDRSLATWESGTDPSRGIKLHDLQLDYVRARFPDRDSLDLIHESIRLSAHVIQNDPQQFASQITGRLLAYRDSTAIRSFIDEIGTGAPRPWVRSLHASLHPPGTELVRTLEGHSDRVNAVALTADGKRAVSASRDNTLKVWDLKSGRLLRTLEGHSRRVKGVALTPDGKRAVSASHDKTLKVWDVESGRALRTLEGHTGVVSGVALTTDGKRAVSASYDKTLKVWDLESGRALRTLEGHSASVAGVALTADSKRAVSASYDLTLKVWELESGRVLRTLEGHFGSVLGVALTADGKRAVSASFDGTLKVWDVETGGTLRTLAGHSGPIYGVALTADGKRAVSASDDATLKVWDVESGRALRTLEGHSDPICGVAVTGDGKRAVSASWDKTLKIWNLARVTSRGTTLEGHSGPVIGAALTPDGKRAVSASYDGTLKVWDVESGRALRTLKGHSGSVSGVALTADGKHAVSASHDYTLKMWDAESGRDLRTLEGHSGPVYSVSLTPDGKRAVSASFDRTLKLWDVESGRALRTLQADSDWLRAVALAPDGKRAVSASMDGTLEVWDLNSGHALGTLEGHSGAVVGVALTPDGKLSVSGSWDDTLKLWDVDTGRELRTLRGHSAEVTGVALMPDGRRAVSASYDKTLKLWDLESGMCLATFHCDGAVGCCACAGAIIVGGDALGRIHFLRLEENNA
jgi:WD40 repeat protein